VEQATDYYPFGRSFEQNNVDKNCYFYNGKELQDQAIGGTPFGWYDYGARFYDPQLGRWHLPDLLEEMFYSINSYAYCINNPINTADISGLYPTKKVVDNGVVGNRIFSKVPVMNPYHKVMRPHYGQDFPAAEGNTVHALAEGEVSKVGYNPGGWGNYIEIKHKEGYTTRYAHLQKGGLRFKKGDFVKNGEIIGLSGMTGGAKGAHLHLEILLKMKAIDPLSIEDLQDLLYGSTSDKIINETNPIVLDELIIVGNGNPYKKSLEAKIEDLKWSSVRPNEFGNTGRYNRKGRSTDQYYSDDFLKWYYDVEPKK